MEFAETAHAAAEDTGVEESRVEKIAVVIGKETFISEEVGLETEDGAASQVDIATRETRPLDAGDPFAAVGTERHCEARQTLATDLLPPTALEDMEIIMMMFMIADCALDHNGGHLLAHLFLSPRKKFRSPPLQIKS